MDLQELTKKNQEFVTIATHQFKEDGKSDEEIEAIFNEVLPTIIENQKQGNTARYLLGAPTAWAKSFSTKTVENGQAIDSATNKNPWLMWMDSSLLFFGGFSLFYGFVNLTSGKTSAQVYGISSILVIALSGAAAFYGLYHFVYRYSGNPKDERPSLWKFLAYMAGFTLLWILAVGLTALIPKFLNPVLPGLATMIIGAISLGLRYYLKKRYNIQSALAATQAPRNTNGK